MFYLVRNYHLQGYFYAEHVRASKENVVRYGCAETEESHRM